MSEPKTFASLSPSLLARKGGARPAMRPQIQPLQHFHEATARQLDDLGWNDMGHDDELDSTSVELEPAAELIPARPQQEAEIVPIAAGMVRSIPADEPVGPPPVVRLQEEAALRIAAASAARPRRSALSDGRRAAFTLRLDAERHLKLRLACTLSGRSAQQLVTEALDSLIAEVPDVATLAAHVRKNR